MNYIDQPYKTPEVFKDTLINGRVLIISNGPSTKHILKYKDKLKKYFDRIIVVNHGFKYFDDVADYHIVTEKLSPNNHVAEMLNKTEYNINTPRIINWKGVEKYNQKYNLYKTVRCQIKDGFDIRSYKQYNYEGLATGPVNGRNMAVGSVTLSSIHFSCIMGASEVYLVGADMIFKDEYDHFYPDNQYRDPKVQNKNKEVNRVHIVKVEFNGKTYQTTDYFRDSANFINKAIETTFKDIKIFDFSDGMITGANQLNIDNFFGE